MGGHSALEKLIVWENLDLIRFNCMNPVTKETCLKCASKPSCVAPCELYLNIRMRLLVPEWL